MSDLDFTLALRIEGMVLVLCIAGNKWLEFPAGTKNEEDRFASEQQKMSRALYYIICQISGNGKHQVSRWSQLKSN